MPSPSTSQNNKLCSDALLDINFKLHCASLERRSNSDSREPKKLEGERRSDSRGTKKES